MKKRVYVHPVVPLASIAQEDGRNVGIMVPRAASGVCDLVWMSREDAEILTKNGYGLRMHRRQVRIDGKVYDYGWTPWAVRKLGNGKYYARTLGRIILNVRKGMVVDHIDGDHMNARRENLRSCTIAQNCLNRTRIDRRSKTGITGVSPVRGPGGTTLYVAYININKKQVRIGYFNDIEQAAAVRRQAELEHYGEFAPRR